MAAIELSNGDVTAVVSPTDGGRLTFGGRTYDLPIDAPPHAIHGTVYRRPWDIDSDGTLLAPGPRPSDDCFIGLPRPPQLTFADGVVVTVTTDPDHWVIYTPEHAVGVEPQTEPPDGPNIAPRVVEPGAPRAVTMTLSWTVPA